MTNTFTITVQKFKDANGKMKRAMSCTLREGKQQIDAVAELTKGSPLQKEIDYIINNMKSQHEKANVHKQGK